MDIKNFEFLNKRIEAARLRRGLYHNTEDNSSPELGTLHRHAYDIMNVIYRIMMDPELAVSDGFVTECHKQQYVRWYKTDSNGNIKKGAYNVVLAYIGTFLYIQTGMKSQNKQAFFNISNDVFRNRNFLDKYGNYFANTTITQEMTTKMVSFMIEKQIPPEDSTGVDPIKEFTSSTENMIISLKKFIDAANTAKLTVFNNKYEELFTAMGQVNSALHKIQVLSADINNTLQNKYDTNFIKDAIINFFKSENDGNIELSELNNEVIASIITTIYIDAKENKFLFLAKTRSFETNVLDENSDVVKQVSHSVIPLQYKLDILSNPCEPAQGDEENDQERLFINNDYKTKLDDQIKLNNECNMKVIEIVANISKIFRLLRGNTGNEIKRLITEIKTVQINKLLNSSSVMKQREEFAKEFTENLKLCEQYYNVLTTITAELKIIVPKPYIDEVDVDLAYIIDKHNNSIDIIQSIFDRVYIKISYLEDLDKRHKELFDSIRKLFESYNMINDTLYNGVKKQLGDVAKHGLSMLKDGAKTMLLISNDYLSNDQIYNEVSGMVQDAFTDGKNLAKELIDFKRGQKLISKKGFYATKIEPIENIQRIGIKNFEALIKIIEKIEGLEDLIPETLNFTKTLNNTYMQLSAVSEYDVDAYEFPCFRTHYTTMKLDKKKVLFYIGGITNESLMSMFTIQEKKEDKMVNVKLDVSGKTAIICEMQKTESQDNYTYICLKYREHTFRVPINEWRIITPFDMALLPSIVLGSDSKLNDMRKFLENSMTTESFKYAKAWMATNYGAKIINKYGDLKKFVKIIQELDTDENIYKNDTNKAYGIITAGLPSADENK